MPQQDQRLIALMIEGGGWRLWAGLLLPLVLIAWQYDFRRVVGYVFGIVLFDVLLTGWMLGDADWFRLVRGELPHATIFILMAYIVTRIMAGQRQQRRELAEANTRLAQYAETLEQLTISRERNRLARELHDTLAHALSAVSVQLEAVDSVWDIHPEKARELLAKALAQTRSGLTETRRALQALRASPLDDLGLALAVRNLAELTARRGSLALELAIDDHHEPSSPEREQHIYRIAQEAMTNVLKHAEAHTLRVALRRSGEDWTLIVGDDGAGFEPLTATANGHFGLQGMHERAELIGAQLAVESRPAQGTQVRLVWHEDGA
jgi:signal transduction histidine kinase